MLTHFFFHHSPTRQMLTHLHLLTGKLKLKNLSKVTELVYGQGMSTKSVIKPLNPPSLQVSKVMPYVCIPTI